MYNLAFTRLKHYFLETDKLAYVDETGGVNTMPGKIKVYIGNVCPNAPERFTSGVLSTTMELKGKPLYFMY